MVTNVEINKDSLYPYLLFNKEIKYNDKITLYPIKAKDILIFQQCQSALTLRKDSIFSEKEIIKMQYLDFIKYAYKNTELSQKYHIPILPLYYDFILQILQISCGEGAAVAYNQKTLDISVNDLLITNEIFDDLRQIIIAQNDIDFNINEFMNIDTVKALEKAREFEAKKKQRKIRN